MRSKKNSDQFRLLMWKNLCVQKKLWKGTIYRITYPLVFGLMIFISHIIKRPEFISEPTGYPSFKVSSLNSDLVPPTGSDIWHLAYTPKTDLTNRIMKRAAELINMATEADLAFNTEDDLVERLKTADDVFGGIVFLFNSKTNLPRNITYKIRLRAEMYAATFGLQDISKDTPKSGSQQQTDMYGGELQPGDFYEGFLAVQRAVDLSVIKEVNPFFDVNHFELRLKQYPRPLYSNDWLYKMLDGIFPGFIVIGFITTAYRICKDIVIEKEKKLKESMKLMGMKSWIHWSSWFFKSAIIVTLSVVLITAALHLKIGNSAAISYTSCVVTFILLLLFSLAVVSFGMALSTLFSKADAGSNTAVYVILFVVALPCYVVINSKWNVTRKLSFSLDFNVALMLGYAQISQFESIGVGMQFSNLNQPFSADDSWTMLHVFGMLVVDIILYAIITWYFDSLTLRDIQAPRPLVLDPLRSCCSGRNNGEVPHNNGDIVGNDQGMTSGLISSDDEERFEKPMADAKVGIEIRGLTKKFKSNGTVAVNNLNIDIYEGNITALVGQNGAGKTTTMFMLTGFLSPTDGDALINGLSIKSAMAEIRENLGLCPQHDILFDWLTVREHLIFFAELKGCPSVEVDSKVSRMLEALHLEDKADVDAINLSGGLKRKLCVGIALIADSKFVILDEPTSGMDPEARRQTWDLLQSQQKGRTIVLSTHYMDEADQLGDRIAIMADGHIQCYGTPMFLKNKYGIGYHMKILKNADCNVDNLSEVIKSHVPEAQLESTVGAEVSFILPRDQSHKFEELFSRLENDQEMLGVESFGASVTTMEEVFLKVGQTTGSVIDGAPLQDSNETSLLEGEQDSALGVAFRNASVCKRHCLQIQGMLVKRIMYYLRDFNSVLIPLAFFIALLSFALRDLITIKEVKDHAPMYLNLSHFINPITPIEVVLQPSLQDDEAFKVANCYADVARSSGSVIYLNSTSDYNNTMGSFLLSIATSSVELYNTKYLTGATIETSESPGGNMAITGWFNNAAHHTVAISLSQVADALMRCFGNKEYSIQTINHPLPWLHKSQVNNERRNALERGTNIEYILPVGIEIFICMFPMFLIKERVTGSKHVQLVSGAKLYNFWFATFLGDFLAFLIPTVSAVIMLESVQLTPYTEGVAIWFVLLDFIFYGFSVIPFVYVLSFLFQTPSTGYCWITVILFGSSIVSAVVLPVVEFFNPFNTTAARALEWVLYICLPNFCFEKAFRSFIPLSQSRRPCSGIGDQLNQSMSCSSVTTDIGNYVAWESPGIGRSLFFMASQSVVLFLILILIDTTAISLQLRRRKGRSAQLKAEIKHEEIELGNELVISLDSDVLRERDRVLSTPVADLSQSDPVFIQDLTKVFDDFTAVDKLSLGIHSGECFGLLGVNGAGKTTCFKILTGELKPSFGSAFVGGKSVWGKRSKVYPYIGYCPQSDALIDLLTVKETLWMFACIHGVSNEKRNQIVDAMIDRLLLKDYTSQQTKTLSGGNKRKLSVAVALIGDPPIIFLDEPTTGMDPVTRRTVWNTLNAVRKRGRTLILTSHSMEECEALCTRIAIMVNGRFQCLGSIQHLKSKFTEGYTLIIKTGGGRGGGGGGEEEANTTEESQKNVNQIKSFVSSTFHGSVLKDHHEGLLNYQIQTPNLSWSQIFGIIEKAKHHLEIEDYSVSQTTLEQVFISFARMQHV